MSNTISIREVSVHYTGRGRNINSSITGPAQAASFARKVVNGDAREHFLTIMLDARYRPIGYQTVSVGTATSALVHPREVFQPAVGLGACAIILAHNHPSGDETPSPEDREITERLRRCGEILGITVLDSIVFSRTGHYSFKEQR